MPAAYCSTTSAPAGGVKWKRSAGADVVEQ
jgi:hypothetical protein